MANTTTTPNMNLIVPTVGQDPGPDYANNINASLNVIDGHNHSTGYGVQITPTGLDINSDLSFHNNNLILARTLRLNPQSATPSNPSDLGCLYETGVDLYYIDGAGNNVRITQGGAVAGAPGSISGLVSPASASYNSSNSTFIWQSATSTPANLDAASVILRNLVASSHGLTLQAPPAMSSDYSLVLPPLPVSQKIMTLDASGNITAPYVVDNSSIVISSNTIEVGTAGITLAMLVAAVQQSLNPAGTILAFAGPIGSIPTGYLYCDGSAVSRMTYSALFTAIGTAWGSGDGSTTFNLPYTKGVFLRGQDNGSGNDPDAASRAPVESGGNSGDNVGSSQGSAFASHGHGVTDSGHHHTVNAGGSSGGGQISTAGTGGTVSTSTATTGIIIQASGASSETRPINVYVNYMVKY